MEPDWEHADGSGDRVQLCDMRDEVFVSVELKDGRSLRAVELDRDGVRSLHRFLGRWLKGKPSQAPAPIELEDWG